MPEIKVDLARVTYPGILEVVAPIIPGSILAIGTLVLSPQAASKILSIPFLGYRSKLITAVFASYVAGLLLYLLLNYVTYFIGYLLGGALAKRPLGSRMFGPPPAPWRYGWWRRAARKLIGPDLAPSTDEPYIKDLHDKSLAEANAITDPVTREERLRFVHDFFFPKNVADNEWYWWYVILNEYFRKPEWWAPPARYFLSMVHSASWAVILLMLINHRHHWLAWSLCALGLLFGNVGSWFADGAYGPDPHGVAQTAKILRLLRPKPDDAKTK